MARCVSEATEVGAGRIDRTRSTNREVRATDREVRAGDPQCPIFRKAGSEGPAHRLTLAEARPRPGTDLDRTNGPFEVALVADVKGEDCCSDSVGKSTGKMQPGRASFGVEHHDPSTGAGKAFDREMGSGDRLVTTAGGAPVGNDDYGAITD